MTDQESSLGYPGWKVVLGGFFGVMVSFAAIIPYTFGLFLKPLSLSFGWSRESISVGFSIAALTVAACSPALGHLLDHYGPRRIILPCIILFSAAFASLALLTDHIAHFYAVFLLLSGRLDSALPYSSSRSYLCSQVVYMKPVTPLTSFAAVSHFLKLSRLSPS